jgi:Chaperone of endosialidase
MTTSLTTRVSTDATYAPAVKGSPISSAEIDNNFISLATNKIETSVMDTAATANKLVLRDSSGNINTVGISASGAIAANSGSITSTQTTFNLLTATVTTLNIGSAATTIQNGYTGTASSTNNIATGAVASGSTKTLNIGTSGVAGSTTTITIGSVNSGSTTIYGGLGIGTAADSANNGSIRALGTITSNYSDERLKTNIEVIPNALEKVCSLRGVTYTANTLAESFGYTSKELQVGVLSQDLEKVLPEAVKPAPFDRIFIEGIEISKSGQDYKTVHYERIVPLLIEAIKELNSQIKELKGVK